MTNKTGTTFVISTRAAEYSFTGFVDMLRYDQATVVESNSTFIILTCPHRPTTGRWASFGIHVLAEQHYGYGSFVDVTSLMEDARLSLSPAPRPRLPGV